MRDFPLAGLDDTDVRRVLASFEPGTVEDVYRLSPLQSGILFHALHRPDRSDYLSQNAYRLSGHLDRAAFIAAWQRALDRHPALRTTFAWDGIAHPVQLVHSQLPVRPRCLDWRGRDEESVARSLAELMAEARDAGMRLDRTPPIALDLIEVGDDEHVFVWHLHHIVADGWSSAIVLEEVYAIYAELTGGPAAELPPAVPYRQHIAWIGDRDHDADLAYWKSSLDGFSVATALPIIGPAPAGGQGRTVKVPRLVAATTTQRLRQLARRQRVTLNAVLQGAWAVLLSRHSGDRSVLHGTVMSGRSGEEPEIERVVGLLVNTAPVRLDVDDAATLPAWLGAVQRQLTNVLRFEHVGLTDIRGCSQVRPGENMFDTVLNFVSFAAPSAGPGASLTVTAERAYEQIGYPLGLSVVFRGELLLQFGYEVERVAAADAERLFAHYEHILEQFAAATEQTLVGDITALPDDERRLVTRDWAGTIGDYPKDATVGELFEAMAARQPDAPALAGSDLAGGEVELTYAQLDGAANRLARILRRRGAGADTRVAIGLPRSADLVVTLLAIVKAGGACLGLDPANPPARLALMIEDSDPVIIVASADTARDLSAVAAGRAVLVIDDPEVAAEITAAPGGPLDQVATPLSLAHICYTSGSTGTPKGVGLIHRGVVRLAFRPSYLRTGAGETFVQLQPIAFDGSLVELYVTLLNGSRLVVPQPGKLDIPEIAALLRRYGVTALGLTTAMFHQMVEYDIDALAGVRQMITGGDVLLPDAFAAPLRIYPGMTVVAGYGPTENTTITTAIAVDDPGQIGLRVPIGRPIPHTTVYVLDEKMRPVPVGVTGELYAGGHGIARGYLNHPAATADRFGPDPFSAEPGGRLYRTGDLARWRPDGVLDFLGRIDGQVKIRGFRIELGEIEARLSQHPDVAEAVVAARPDANGHKRLVAYLVAAGASAPSAASLKKFVKQELPEYMVPSAVVMLDALPMNVNGKIDRAALPDPADQARGFGSVAPGTPAEKTLTSIWQRILGTMQVGIKDNFFDLGGDSILSIQVASEARAAGLPLTSALLFSHQSIEELAEALAEVPEIDPPEQGLVTGDVALTPIQSAFLHGGGPHNRFTQSVLLRCRLPVEPDLLHAALDALLAHHDALRLRAARVDGRWSLRLPGIETGRAHLDVIELPDLAVGPLDEVIKVAADQVHGGMDLAAGPMLRAALFRYRDGRGDHLLIAVHHLAVDVVSWGFLLADLETAYRALAAGATPTLPPKTTSVKAWAQELARLAESADVDLDLRYWRESAHQAEPLPLDDESGADPESTTSAISVALSPPETDVLLTGLPRFGGIRTVDLLVAALVRTLSQWAGGQAVTLDFESHGRDPLSGQVDTARTVGWFTSIYPVSFTLPDPDDLGACLHAVREQLRAVPRHGIAYGISRELRSPQDSGAAATSAARPAGGRVSFNYLGRWAAQLPPEAFFSLEPFTWGQEVDPCRPRPYLLDIVAYVDAGKLTVAWRYSESRYRGPTISALAGRFIDNLRTAITHVTKAPELPAEQEWRQHLFPGTALALGPMARYRVPGASFAVVADGRIQSWTYGLADAESGTRVTPDTVFQLGSISKHLTALAVLRLAQDGVVDLDADVNMYLSTWRLPQLEGSPPASLRQLLSHSAGLAPAEARLYAPGELMPSVADLLGGGPGGLDRPVCGVSVPGTVQEYSGVNYAVAELAVTEVTGLSFADALIELVLRPLGLKDTSFAREFPAERQRATGHGHTAAGRRYSNPWHDFPSPAAGGLWSTPTDLARVAMEIQAAVRGNGTLLTRSSAVQLLPNAAHGYGLGAVVKTVNGVRWYGHPGDSPGFRSLFAFTIDHGTAIVAFTNGDGGTQMLEDLLGGIGVDLIMRVQGDRRFT